MTNVYRCRGTTKNGNRCSIENDGANWYWYCPFHWPKARRTLYSVFGVGLVSVVTWMGTLASIHSFFESKTDADVKKRIARIDEIVAKKFRNWDRIEQTVDNVQKLQHELQETKRQKTEIATKLAFYRLQSAKPPGLSNLGSRSIYKPFASKFLSF